jgi:predicted kinase
VIVAGAPATGKTTLAKRLAADLRLTLLTKDEIKERLADALGAGDRERSRELGVAAYAILYLVARKILETGSGVVVEANFYRDRSAAPLRELAAGTAASVVLCRADAAARRARFTGRSGRHAVHLDEEIARNEWPESEEPFAIDIGTPRLVVDTTAGYAPDVAAIEAFVRA